MNIVVAVNLSTPEVCVVAAAVVVCEGAPMTDMPGFVVAPAAAFVEEAAIAELAAALGA